MQGHSPRYLAVVTDHLIAGCDEVVRDDREVTRYVRVPADTGTPSH